MPLTSLTSGVNETYRNSWLRDAIKSCCRVEWSCSKSSTSHHRTLSVHLYVLNLGRVRLVVWHGLLKSLHNCFKLYYNLKRKFNHLWNYIEEGTSLSLSELLFSVYLLRWGLVAVRGRGVTRSSIHWWGCSCNINVE